MDLQLIYLLSPRQLTARKFDKWFQEKISAKDANRPQLQAMLDFAREGIAIAKREHRYKGRKEIKIDDFPAHYERYLRREVTKKELAESLHISRPTLNKLIANMSILPDEPSHKADFVGR